MTGSTPTLRERLAGLSNLSGAESALTSWIERNLHALPFESAANVAEGAGVSEMSVSRFVRKLGYDGFRALKAELKAQTVRAERPEFDDRLRRFALPSGDPAELNEALRLEIEAILDVYRLAKGPAWQDALDVIERAERVSVAGFQGSKGLALDFATRLKWTRPGVRFVEGTSGTWSEVFDEDPTRSCLVLLDTALYARTSLKLAEMAQREGMPMVIVTDRFGNWARKFTPHVLSVSTWTNTWWDSSAGLSALLGLLLNGLTMRAGPAARARLKRLSALGQAFETFADDSASPTRPAPDNDEESK
ncbi:MAG: MurR/RpiR family transcriptional regulator [Rhodobacter sp.]|nr:MurR/RpiR family transcriptional regulator [Rhodobacter sp.]